MQTLILDINTQNTKYRIQNTKKKSELTSLGNIMQNIKLVVANFDIGHHYSKHEIQNTKKRKSELTSFGNIMQNINLVFANFDIGHQYSKYEIQNTKYKYKK